MLPHGRTSGAAVEIFPPRIKTRVADLWRPRQIRDIGSHPIDVAWSVHT